MSKKYLLLAAVLFGTVVSAQVKIGGTDGTPNANAMLEVEATDKGVLLPRVALESTASANPLSAHVQGMTVYNTASVGDVTPGQYYNDGTKWNRVVNSDEVPAGVIITADNGLTKTGDNIQLGGELEAPTAIIADATNTLAIEGLQQTATIASDKIVVMDANGVMKTANASDFAKTMNTTVFKAYKGAGGWSLLTLGGGWTRVPLVAADQEIKASSLLSGGNYVVPSDGVYQIKYEFRMQGVNANLLGESYLGLIKNGIATPIEQKPLDAVNLTLNLLIEINLASVPITATTFDTILELEEGDTLGFAIRTGLDLGVASNKQVHVYIYKISD